MTSQRMAWIGAGVVFLLFCGWKFTFGLEHVLDLRLGDETKYLSYALGYDAPDNPAQWSPLYVALYRLEHIFIGDPIDLYFFHQKLVASLLPICLFIYLVSRRVPFVIAIAGAGYFMISVANLAVEPKTMQVALAGMFACLALFVGLGQHPARWGLMLAAAALLSFIRPEFAIAFLGFAVSAAYLVIATRDRRLTASVVIGLGCAVTLYAYVGFPMWGGRTVFAFAQSFALNYGAWHNIEDPWMSDYQQIFQTVFPHANSIAGALVANPSAFIHHLASNLVHSPIEVAGVILGHFNVVLPRFRLYTLAEAGLLAFALLAVVYAFGQSREEYWTTAWTRVRSLPEASCLIIFALPFALMMVVLYPRNHYALGFGAILFALMAIALSGGIQDSTWLPKVAVLSILLIMVPSLGSAGARVDASIGTSSLVPRPVLETAYFLRGLGIRSVVRVCGAETPGAGIYAGPNFRSISALDKQQSLTAFLMSYEIAVLVVDARLRHVAAFTQDPAWSSFQSTPEKFGFTAYALPDSGDLIVYVASWARS
jgi:hypothetical protein